MHTSAETAVSEGCTVVLEAAPHADIVCPFRTATESTIWSFAFSPCGHFFAVGLTGTILLYTSADGASIATIKVTEDALPCVTSIALSLCASHVYAGIADSVLKLTPEGSLVAETSECGDIMGITPNQVFVWEEDTPTLCIFCDNLTLLVRVDLPGTVLAATLCIDKAVCVCNERIVVVDGSGVIIKEVDPPGQTVRCAVMSPCGGFVAYTHPLGVEVLDVVTGEEVLDVRMSHPHKVAYTPCGRYLIVYEKASLEQVCVRTGEILGSITEDCFDVFSLSPCGTKVLFEENTDDAMLIERLLAE